MNNSVICFLIMFSPLLTYSQTLVKGKIVNSQNTPLPYVTIYIEGTTNGTTSDESGDFQLRVEKGNHTLVAQHIGYRKEKRTVEISNLDQLTVNFTLREYSFKLRQVTVSNQKRKYARDIIRNAIKTRLAFRDKVRAFSCEAYVKGAQQISKRPKKLLGIKIPIDTGIVYLSESISEISFRSPNHINERMIASKVSGNDQAFSHHQASDLLTNLYKGSFYIEGLSERPFISPLSNNAFYYYDYQLEGSMIENDQYISKIKVIPRRKSDPVFSGFLYIINESWQVHSADLTLTKENGLDLIDTIQVKLIFASVTDDLWMPVSLRFTFQFNMLGFEGKGYYTGIFREYKIESASETNKSLPLFRKKEYSNALLTIEEGANKKDSVYWAKERPIPLTSAEENDFHTNDSTQRVWKSKPFMDTLDHIQNRYKFGNLVFKDYRYANSYKHRSIILPTLLKAIQYNSVEGLAADLTLAYEKRNDYETTFKLTPSIRYGFANHTPQAKLEVLKVINNKKQEMISGGLGRYVFQFNRNNPISALNNSFVTLTQARNLAKFYQKTFIHGSYQRELINGIMITTGLTYESRQPMINHATYNFKHDSFTPNTPVNEELENTDFDQHEALLVDIQLRIRFDQKYIDRPDAKVILDSRYPDLFLSYKKAVPILESETNYDLAKVGLSQTVRLGIVGTTLWSAWAGAFLNTQTMTFVDYYHFNGNRTFITLTDGAELFQLLRYYNFSTQKKFAEFHFDHHFNEFIFNKIPFVKKLDLQAVASLNYLTTPTIGHYVEFGVGIEHILKIARADFYTAFHNTHHYGLGFRLGIGI